MRPRFAALYAAACLALAAGLGACEDPYGGREAIVRQDTVVLAAAGAGQDSLASALDFVFAGTPRFPERIGDADRWDVAVRSVNGQLVLRPYPATATLRGAGISPPQARDFDDATRAPRSRADYREEPVALQEGSVYFVRSRQYVEPPGILCVRFAKLRPLEVDAEAGTVRVEFAVNGFCDDERLRVEDDD